jgi:hypothetical protein
MAGQWGEQRAGPRAGRPPAVDGGDPDVRRGGRRPDGRGPDTAPARAGRHVLHHHRRGRDPGLRDPLRSAPAGRGRRRDRRAHRHRGRAAGGLAAAGLPPRVRRPRLRRPGRARHDAGRLRPLAGPAAAAGHGGPDRGPGDRWPAQADAARRSGDAKLLPQFDLGQYSLPVQPGRSYTLGTWYHSTARTQYSVYYRTWSGRWVYWTSSPYFPACQDWTQASWATPPLPAARAG